MNMSLSVDRVKEQRDANKYPRRKCIKCIRYPCFKGQGTPMHQVNFAAYGCKQYSNHEVRTEKPGENKKRIRRRSSSANIGKS